MNRSSSRRAALLTAWLLSGAMGVDAYELQTHQQVTAKAFDKAFQASRHHGLQNYLIGVGIALDDHFTVEAPSSRAQLDGFVNTGRVQEWMSEGAIREDDYKTDVCGKRPTNPKSDTDRPANHFFDVQRNGRGLTVTFPFPIGTKTIGLPAPDWALGIQDRDKNKFTILDAREYQFQSLAAVTPADRNRNTAKLFRALGQVAHVLEDMAQPQHTRNDPHGGCEEPSGVDRVAGPPRWYEWYAGPS